eukprot:6956460-Ditylum_brightwellii.AAC.1
MESQKLEPDKIEKADRILLDASLYAEKQCKFCPRSWWSLPLAKAKFKLNTLKTHLSQLRCGIAANTRKTKYSITINCPPTLVATQAELSKTQREVKTITHKSKEKRRESNETLAEIHALTRNTSTEKALKSIMNAEKMQQVWKKIGHADKKHIDSLMTTFQIPIPWPSTTSDEHSTIKLDNPKTANSWRTVGTPKEVAFYLKLRNQLHFGQAKGTPFTVPPLSE